MNYTALTVSGCGHTVELDCTGISRYPVPTMGDVVCTERGNVARGPGSSDKP